VRRVYLALAIIAPIIGGVVMMQPASCQLPPTNMGKYVHQPGDNQYDKAAQQERHGQPAPVMVPVVNQGGGGGGGGGGNGWVPTPRIPKPDISLEPIVADEPVVAAGFPPMPDKVDLPISGGWGRASGGLGGGSYGGAGGGGGSSGPPMPTGTHQHYNHFDPGAFVQNKSNSSNKVNTAPMPSGRIAEQFSAAGNGAPGGGIEPRLNPANDRAMPTEAPTAVTVKQATTQDLSLPDDDFSYKNQNKQNGGNRYLKQMGRSLMMPLQTIPSMAGSGMTSKIKF
jgi:hypothetical protein